MVDWNELEYVAKTVRLTMEIPCRVMREDGGESVRNAGGSDALADGDAILQRVLADTRKVAGCQDVFVVTSEIGTHYIVMYLSDSGNESFVAGPYLTTSFTVPAASNAFLDFGTHQQQVAKTRDYLKQIRTVNEKKLLSVISLVHNRIFDQTLFQGRHGHYVIRYYDYKDGTKMWNDTAFSLLENNAANRERDLRKQLMWNLKSGFPQYMINDQLSLLFDPDKCAATGCPWTEQALRLYCASLNGLFREAVLDNPRVFPAHINAIYNDWMTRIEQATLDFLKQLPFDMLNDYSLSIVRFMHIKHNGPIGKAIIYIIQNLSTPLKISDIASAVGISESYLSQRFKKELGVSVVNFANMQRATRAQTLIELTNLSIQEIGNRVGIPDAGYFTKIFKKHTGVTPTAYRDSFLAKKASESAGTILEKMQSSSAAKREKG